MDLLKIEGSTKLSGEVSISGAKNAALPMIALTLLAKNRVEISNMPEVVDIKTLLKLIENLGGSYEFKNNHVSIDTTGVNNTKATYEIVKTMRASILVLGPLLTRFGYCEVSLPGGCAIGQRPIDLHLKALEQMGAEIIIKSGYVQASAPNGLKGAHIIFDKITVTGTANIVMAAALAHGKTTIVNAAREPEVVQLCEILRESGVGIEGVGTSELVVYGSDRRLLEVSPFKIIPDRIEAGTYLCAAAITNSKLKLTDVRADHLEAVTAKLSQMGFTLDITSDTITIHPTNRIKPVDIITQEYPAFPTDMQAQFVALATQADGVSTIEERLFENRFMHVSELQRLGADIRLNGNVATIKGPSKLYATDVMATDLRASSALVLAAMIAEGESKIHRIYHLDRGYEKLEEKLKKIGAKTTREKE
jgi:UDP-N-acetylglucosamine 1-carboxyvinyltransferase